MEGYVYFIPCLLSIVLAGVLAASAWQTVNLEYLTSLQEHRYTNLLKDMQCSYITSDEDQLNHCEIAVDYMRLHGILLTDEWLAKKWLNAVNEIEIDVSYEAAIADFNYATNMTDYNQEVNANVSILINTWTTTMKEQARQFDYHEFGDETLRRAFEILLRGDRMDDNEQRKKLDKISSEMVTIYGKGKVCRSKQEKYDKYGRNSKSDDIKDHKQDEEDCLTLEPDLEGIMAHSRDYDELLWAWKGWRDAVGPDIGKLYPGWVELQNMAANNGNYTDMGKVWREKYEMTDDRLEPMVDALFEDVRPLYQLLHAFLRRRLSEQYPGRVNPTGPIPAHVFGNMWAQHWNNIYDIAKPYRDVEEIDVTEEMLNQKYDATHMFKVAEEFFTSIGMDPMPDNFWKYSMIEKPSDRDVVCHASAYDFTKDREVRIKMCTEVDMEYLNTIHHEMGHCEYYLEYSKQPLLFRSGANPGFHEAVGDTIALSVTTPSHLQKLRLMDSSESNKEKTINHQMKMALSKIAFLPFGLMIDKWRWEVFRGNIKPEEYNTKWWEYRLKYQGIVPPVERTEDDFDPGAKYHIPSGTPYIRYFISYLIQFQFQRALCNEAGFEGPLHECSIYQSKEAGAKLKKMLALGMSRPWTEALEVLTGQTEIDTSAIKEYFAPLIEWIKENTKDEVLGWEEVVPETDEEQEISEEQNEEKLLEELELLAELEEFKRFFS